MRHFVVLRSLWTRGISFLTGWIHGKENRGYMFFEFNSFCLGDFSRRGMRFRWRTSQWNYIPAPPLLPEPWRGMAPNIGIPEFYFIYRLE
ncbi:unnamed protein product [Rhizophagus irregularis]|nr:unnamed protein product [Rhizophagus irregularis]